jgi:hypothetical protein
MGELEEEGHEIEAYYFNPNIHPYSEFLRRLQALREFGNMKGVRLIVPEKSHGMEQWFRAVSGNEASRCSICYHIRLEATAGEARERGFDSFSTTLLYSKFQKHELIRRVGRAMAEKYSVEFLYRDWRTGWNRGVKIYRKLGLYRQKYCGCVYSEKERALAWQKRDMGEFP